MALASYLTGTSGTMYLGDLRNERSFFVGNTPDSNSLGVSCVLEVPDCRDCEVFPLERPQIMTDYQPS
jgi:hypothetical protein